MAARGAPSERKDFQTGRCSWIPTTTAIPNSTAPRRTCKDWQSSKLVQPVWNDSGQYNRFDPTSQANSSGVGISTADFLQTTQYQTTRACYAPMGLTRPPAANSSVLEENLRSFDSWQATEAASFHGFREVTNKDDKFAGISFQKLMALVGAQGNINKTTSQNVLSSENFGGQMEFGAPSSSSRGLHLHSRAASSMFRGPHFHSRAASSMSCGPHFHSRAAGGECNTCYENSGLHGRPVTWLNTGTRNSITSTPSFDLNATPRMTTDAVYNSRSVSFPFQPITPQKTNKAGYHQQIPVIDLTIDEVPRMKDAQNVENSRSSLIIDQVDKGGTCEADLTKTPQQKARRRKHRPKVIIEGKKKSTPKDMKKPTGAQESSARRKYVRRKVDTNPLSRETGGPDLNKSDSTKGIQHPDSNMHKETRKTENLKASQITRSSCKRALNFNSDDQAGGQSSLKKQNVSTSAELELSNRNEMGAYYNFGQACIPILSQSVDKNVVPQKLYFPTIYKKKRTEKIYSVETSSSQLKIHTSRVSCTNQITPAANQGMSGGLCDIADRLRMNPANDAIQTGRGFYEDLVAWGSKQSIQKKRSKCSTRLRDLASLLEICRQLPASTSQSAATPSRMKQKITILHEPPTCMEALVADTRAVLKTKKRTKRSLLENPTVHKIYNHQKSATIPMEQPLALTWRTISPVDSIMEQLNRLDLNETSQASEKRNAYLAYHSHYQEQCALVPFHRSGSLIPFGGSFNDARRRRPRPKVDLDDETTRVWKLLLENINSEGVDGTDEGNTKRWEEERRVFNGRADSFIARMHLVQGDRRFSPWKGSVVDSVVGVFLTQNVSDHLSSSAFMSVAARFPVMSKTEFAELHEEKQGTEGICELDHDCNFGLNYDILSKSFCGDRHQVFKSDSATETIHVNASVISNETAASKSISLIEDVRDAEDTFLSQTPENSSQNSSNSPIAQLTERSDSCLPSTSEENPKACTEPNGFDSSFIRLLQMAGTVLHQNPGESIEKIKSGANHQQCQLGSLALDLQNEVHLDNPIRPAEITLPSSYTYTELLSGDISEMSSESASGTTFQKMTDACTAAKSKFSSPKNPEHFKVNSNQTDYENYRGKMIDGPKGQGRRPKKEKETNVNWDNLRKQAEAGGRERARTANTMDSVDWDAVRCADVNEIAHTIKERGMNNMLAERIKDFLNRLVRDHGSIDLEWLRDVPPDEAKEYLLSIRGLGLKSVECVRLLTLHHLAFPVDTNVGRIAVRLGWVPLQPLPESLQLHLLELYPVLESIQKYLWPRLCKLDQRTLYELHYQMITFGKVFCTKSKPNCNACPMRGECRHFASAFASARLSLPAPEEKSIVSATENSAAHQNPMRMMNTEEKSIVNAIENSAADQIPMRIMNTLQLPSPEANKIYARSGASNSQPIIEEPPSPEPIIEVAATPEQDYAQYDIEDAFNEDSDEIPTIQLNMEEFTHNLQKIMEQNMELQDGNMSKALVALTSAAASIPVPKLKNVSRLRTEHHVYELPDSHPLLEGMDRRDPDDPCPYLFAIWTPGETANSVEPPERRCSSKEFDKLCTDEACSSCNSIREADSLTVRGTLLIPCRTAMRGSFPLNGTYFQVNEVFSDHESSLSPIAVPRKWLWNLSRRTVYFGTSIPTIFKGLTTEGIQYCFWRGFVCVRGFDRKTRAPRPLIARLHFPASRLGKTKEKMDEK